MDEIDRAQQQDAMNLTDALAARAAKAAHHAALFGAVPSAIDCNDCGVAIPEARRQAAPGCQRCITCQATAEVHHGR